MKLIIKEFLAGLKESGELDALLPDLLSAMKFIVLFKAQKGVRQFGVDIAASGSIDGQKKVYLFTVKEGDVDRRCWNGDSPQDVRPSIDEILDVYIKSHIPPEYKECPIEIVLVCGGDMKQDVAQNWNGYVGRNLQQNINLVFWNGDKLAGYIEQYLLNEYLLPSSSRKYLRKSLAFMDQPQQSFRFWNQFLVSLCGNKPSILKTKEKQQCLKTINLALNMLLNFGVDEDNLQCPLLAAERSILVTWEMIKTNSPLKRQSATKIDQAFVKLSITYRNILVGYHNKIFPMFEAQYSFSQLNPDLCNFLQLFDVLGKVGTGVLYCSMYDKELRKAVVPNLVKLINNNPMVSSPLYDNHINDLAPIFLILFFDGKIDFLKKWLHRILDRITSSYVFEKHFPLSTDSYDDLLKLKFDQVEDISKLRASSLMLPILCDWLVILNMEDLYIQLRQFIIENLKETNLQVWYPNEETENCCYLTNASKTGDCQTSIQLPDTLLEYKRMVCENLDQVDDAKVLSCFKYQVPAISSLFSQHYRTPVVGIFQYEEIRKMINLK